MNELTLSPIAYIYTDFPEKFGVPRQSGLVNELKGRVVFVPEFRDINAVREIEQYTDLWLIWGFSENEIKEKWQPTVRPPRLGGNTRVGVFATRSPNRPNPIGLSAVKLEKVITDSADSPVLIVSGIDMVNGTPIYDIKPYLPYVDSISGASDGFALAKKCGEYEVVFDSNDDMPEKEKREALTAVLSQDPRPQYQDDPERIYNMSFAEYEVSFYINEKTVHVTKVRKR